jgi:hypothetical protein
LFKLSRALRKDSSKEEIGARILIPTVLSNDKDNFFGINEFKNVKNILTSLAIYDDAIKEEILLKMKNCGEIKEHKEMKERIFFTSGSINIEDINKISLQMYNKLGERSYFTWDNNLRIVLKYKENNEGKNPQFRDEDNKGSWIFNQFAEYKKGELFIERKYKIDKYNLIKKELWNTLKENKGINSNQKRDENWYKNLNVVLKYKEENDDENPTRSELGGPWLAHQREYYRKGTMSENRKKEFDKYKFINKDKWNIIKNETGNKSKENLDKIWYKNLNVVLKYKEENDDENPTRSELGGPWLAHQREYYRKGTMSKIRKKEFDKYKFINKNEWCKNK